MRLVAIAVAAFAMFAATGYGGDRGRKATKKSSTSEQKKKDVRAQKVKPVDEIIDSGATRGTIVFVAENARYFDVRAVKGIVRVHVKNLITLQESFDSEPVPVSMRKVIDCEGYAYLVTASLGNVQLIAKSAVDGKGSAN